MSSTSEAWTTTFSAQHHDQILAPSYDAAADGPRRCGDDSVPFLLCMKSLQGLSARQVLPASSGDPAETHISSMLHRSLSGRKDSVTSQKTLRVSMSMFSADRGTFLGRTWSGDAVLWEDQSSAIQQNVVFHTSCQDLSCHIVLELVLGDRTGPVCIGWTFIPLAELFNAAMAEDGDTSGTMPLRLKLYHGTPRCLLFMESPYDSERRLVSRIGTELICSLSIHTALFQAMSYISADTFYAAGAIVPGLRLPSANTAPLQRPKLLPTHSVTLHKLQLRPTLLSMDELEEQVTSAAVRLAVAKSLFPNMDVVSATVLERRLKIAYHNGHAFVREPQTVLLDVTVGKPSSRGSVSRKSTVSPGNAPSGAASSSLRGSRRLATQSSVSPDSILQLSGQLEVHDVMESDQFALVFLLEYVVSLRSTAQPPSNPAALATKSSIHKKVSRANSVATNPKETISIPVAHNAWSFPAAGAMATARSPDGSGRQATLCLLSSCRVDAGNLFVVSTAQDTNQKSIQGMMLEFQYSQVSPFSTMSSATPLGTQRSTQPSPLLDQTTIATGTAVLGATAASRRDASQRRKDWRTSTVEPGVLPKDIVAVGDSLAFDRDELLPLADHATSTAQSSYPSTAQHSTMATATHSESDLQQPVAMSLRPTDHRRDTLEESMEQVTMVTTYTTAASASAAGSRRHAAGLAGTGTGADRHDDQSSEFPGAARQQAIPHPAPMISGFSSIGVLPRSLLSLLNSSIFPPIQPTLTTTPGIASEGSGSGGSGVCAMVEVSPEPDTVASVAREHEDKLQSNEIVLQILALSGFESSPPGVVYFQYQFYDFSTTVTDRCECISADGSGDIHLLRRIPGQQQQQHQQQHQQHQQHSRNTYGVESHYTVDWTAVDTAEHYLQYCNTARLLIQMFNGNSLLPLATAAVPIEHILRQGRPAIQCSHALDLVVMETANEEPYLVGDWTRQGSSHATGQKFEVVGKLYVRTANLGSPADPRTMATRRNEVVISSKASHLLSAPARTEQNESRQRNALVKVEAKKMTDVHPQLRHMLGMASHGHKTELDRKAELDKKRKLDRMKAVRDALSSGEITSQIQSTPLNFQLQKQQLQIIKHYKAQISNDVIERHHLEGISNSHTVYASLGVVHLVEFQLYNPYTVPTAYSIVFDDPELDVVTDSKEWRFLKDKYNISTPLEENMFLSVNQFQQSSSTNTGITSSGDTTSRRNPNNGTTTTTTTTSSGGNADSSTAVSSVGCSKHVLLRARETLHIPFKYCWRDCSQDGHHDVQNATTATTRLLGKKTIKVTFMTEKSRSPIAILSLTVVYQPAVVHHTLTFHHGESSVMKRCVRISPSLAAATSSSAGVSSAAEQQRLCTFCNAPGVDTQVLSEESSPIQDIYLKVPCGAAPATTSFIVLLYRDEFLITPIARWLCQVQAVHRVDISGQMYQSSNTAVVLRGSNVAHNVQCFVSKPVLLEVWPSGCFSLPAQSITDVQLTLRPTSVCKTTAILSVVDVDHGNLVAMWQVHCNCLPPTITKVTHVKIPSTGGKHCRKQIKFKNSYPVRKSFCVATSRRDLLHLKETRFDVQGNQSQSLALSFVPRPKNDSAEVLVFINLEDGGNEECLSINVTYT